MWAALRRYLKLDLSHLTQADWQLSVFRVLVLSGLLLVLAIILHSSWVAWQLNAYHIIALTLSFYLALLLMLWLARRAITAAAVAFLLLMVAAGLSILLFNPDFEHGKLGLIFLYAVPMVALFFLPLRYVFGLMLLNVLPFALLIYNKPLPPLFGFNITLPATHTYLHGLLFLFFNLCLPLAAARASSVLRQHAKQWQQAHQELLQSHDFYAELFEHNGEATLLVAANGRIVKANSKACQLLHMDSTQPANLHQLLQPQSGQHSPNFWLAQDLPCIARQHPERQLQLKHMLKTRQQHHILQVFDVTALHDLKQALDEKTQQEALWQHFDRLTCLPNSSYFCTQLEQRRQQQTADLYLCFIVRLCHIKTLNQQFGYEFGSGVLTGFCQKLRQRLAPETLLGRVRGVKFAIALKVAPQDIAAVLANLRLQLPTEWQQGSQTVQLRYQIGYCLAGVEVSAQTMLQRCEIALEQATQPDSMVAYAAEVAASLQQDYLLANALREAIRQRQLELHLQPKVNAFQQIHSFEALCRWYHDGQWIAPDRFIALAQQHGLIKELSAAVLEQAIAILDDWQALQLNYAIAINLAGPELLDDQFFAGLLSQSAYYPWLTALLQLELTETDMTVANPQLHIRLKALRQYGFHIAIDDFGTGHASLSQLVDLPVDTIKIDRRFVAAIPQHKSQVKVLYSTLQLARALNLTVVAEGVETDIQQRFLTKLGFGLLQGYLFGKPAPASHWQQVLLTPQDLLPTDTSDATNALGLYAVAATPPKPVTLVQAP